MNDIFQFVYRSLKKISELTNLTYHEVNIMVLILIPALLIYFLGRAISNKKLILYYIIFIVIVLLVIEDFKTFSTNLFNASVDFLKWFDKLGLNYIQASVIICVFIPIMVLILIPVLRRYFGLKRHSIN